MIKRLLNLALVSSVFIVSCKKTVVSPDPLVPIKTTADIKVSSGFTWENARNVNFTIDVKSINLLDAIHVVSIYNGETGLLLGKGSATLLTPFKTKIYLSNLITSVNIVVNFPDGSTISQKLTVGSDEINTTIGL